MAVGTILKPELSHNRNNFNFAQQSNFIFGDVPTFERLVNIKFLENFYFLAHFSQIFSNLVLCKLAQQVEQNPQKLSVMKLLRDERGYMMDHRPERIFFLSSSEPLIHLYGHFLYAIMKLLCFSNHLFAENFHRTFFSVVGFL